MSGAGPDDAVARAEALLASSDLADVAAAEALLLGAMARDPRARPLAARAFDRRRRLRGEPQKFGTEVVECDGRRALWPVDPATTDSERSKWGLPSLTELRRAATG